MMANKKIYYALFSIGLCLVISCAPSKETIKSEDLPPTPAVIATPASPMLPVLPVLSEAEGSEAEGSVAEEAIPEQTPWIKPSPKPTPKLQPTPFPTISRVPVVPVSSPGVHKPEDTWEEEFTTGRESDQAEAVEDTAALPPLIPGDEIMYTPTPIPSVMAARRPISTADTRSGTAGWLAMILIVFVLLSTVVYLYWRRTQQRRKPGKMVERPPDEEIRIPSQYETDKLEQEKLKPTAVLPEAEKKTELQPEVPVETKAISEVREEPKEEPIEIKPVTALRVKAVRRKKISRYKTVKKTVKKIAKKVAKKTVKKAVKKTVKKAVKKTVKKIAKKAVKKAKILPFPKQNTG